MKEFSREDETVYDNDAVIVMSRRGEKEILSAAA